MLQGAVPRREQLIVWLISLMHLERRRGGKGVRIFITGLDQHEVKKGGEGAAAAAAAAAEAARYSPKRLPPELIEEETRQQERQQQHHHQQQGTGFAGTSAAETAEDLAMDDMQGGDSAGVAVRNLEGTGALQNFNEDEDSDYSDEDEDDFAGDDGEGEESAERENTAPMGKMQVSYRKTAPKNAMENDHHDPYQVNVWRAEYALKDVLEDKRRNGLAQNARKEMLFERSRRMRLKDERMRTALKREKVSLGKALHLQEQVKRNEDLMIFKRCEYVRDRNRFTKTIAPFKQSSAFKWQRGPFLGDGPLPTRALNSLRDPKVDAALKKYMWDSNGRRHERRFAVSLESLVKRDCPLPPSLELELIQTTLDIYTGSWR